MVDGFLIVSVRVRDAGSSQDRITGSEAGAWGPEFGPGLELEEPVPFCTFFTRQCLSGGADHRRELIAEDVRSDWEYQVGNAVALQARQVPARELDQDTLFAKNLEQGSAEGVCNLPISDLFDSPKAIVWKQVYARTAFVLVLEEDENVPAGIQLLQVLPSIVTPAIGALINSNVLQPVQENAEQHKSADAAASASRAEAKSASLVASQVEISLIRFPHVIHIILHFFVPGGVLPFLMPSMIDHLRSKALQTLSESDGDRTQGVKGD